MVAVRASLAWCLVVLVCAGCAAPGGRAYVDADAEFARAAALRSRREHRAAAEAFGRFASDFEHDSRAHYAQYLCGMEHAAAGRTAAAVDAFDALHRRFPYSPYLERANERCLELGRRWLNAGDAAGVECLEALAARAPHTETAARARMALGRYYFGKDRIADAKHQFDTAALEYPSAAWKARAELSAAVCEFHQIEQPARNIDHVATARKRFRKLRTASLSAAEMRLVDRHFTAALNAGALHHLHLARFYLKQGRVEPCLAHLQELLAQYPGTVYAEAAAELMRVVHEEVAE